jgi:hypothetical protein
MTDQPPTHQPEPPLGPFEQLIARFAVLESITGSTLAMHLATTRDDPDHAKARKLIEAVRQSATQGLVHFRPPAREDAERYLNVLLSRVETGLPATHGGSGGPTH